MTINTLSILVAIVFDTNISRLNGASAIFSILLLISYYYDRFRCLDQCLKPDVKTSDIIRAKRLFIVTGIWACVVFFGLGAILQYSYLICLLVYLCGWGLLSLYARPLLAKIEDPEKKRTHFYSLLPKEPPRK